MLKFLYTRNNLYIIITTYFTSTFFYMIYKSIQNSQTNIDNKIIQLNKRLDNILLDQKHILELINKNSAAQNEAQNEAQNAVDKEYLEDCYDNIPKNTISKKIFSFW